MTINLHQIKYFAAHFVRASRKGHGVHSPFAYRLCEEVFYNQEAFHDFKQLNAVRTGLLMNEETLLIEDFGAGSKTFKNAARKVKDIALKGVSTRRQSELLYRLMNFLNVQYAVEMGTSLGLNTLYMAKVNAAAKVISMEGSKALFDFSMRLAKKNKISNVEFIHAVFDRSFPEVLAGVPRLDLLYVDGNHTYEATLNYFEQALAKKHRDTVFVFDDIYWSPGMTKAWEEIKRHPDVTLSIDTFYFGLVFFKDDLKEKIELRILI